MVVSVLNTGPSNHLTKPTLETSLTWGESSATSSPETDQQSCILNFDARDQRASSPVQNGEENSCYSSEPGAENLSPQQENSRSSASEELGANLFPISGFGNTTNDYLNSEEKDSPPSSPPYFQDDDMYQTTKSGNNNKPKVHKCRSCGFTTTSKYESWEHIAQHMKPEKILRCSKCPFVTEYKHHLDFHLWNHEGKKPFKCTQCAYECVNKSMLKSHMKSHSSVFPFRCQTCTYKTKYCHSMKIHLRRLRTHIPAPVLDEDGNPDPNLFIDIHSNRRGPKQKNKKSDGSSSQRQQHLRQQSQQLHLQQQQQQQLPQTPHIPNTTVPPPMASPPALQPLALAQFNNYGPWSDKVFPAGENGPLPYPLLPTSIMAAAAAAASFHPDLPKRMLSSHETDHLNNNGLLAVNQNSPGCSSSSQNEEHEQQQQPESENEEIFMPDSCIEEKPSVQLAAAPFYIPAYEPLPLTIPSLVNCCRMPIAQQQEGLEQAPLNLSPHDIEAPLNLSLSHCTTSHATATDNSNVSSAGSSSSSSSSNTGNSNCLPASKNRRKGVACKLKRNSLPHESNIIDQAAPAPKPQSASPRTGTGGDVASSDVSMETSVTETLSEAENEAPSRVSSAKSNVYYCEYCEITFSNQIMFSLHKGCHGFSDPFTCNRCGAKTDNKIDFYSHMISAAHL